MVIQVDLRLTSLKEKMEDDSESVVEHQFEVCYQLTSLRDGRLERLKVYKDENHNHEAQKPEVY